MNSNSDEVQKKIAAIQSLDRKGITKLSLDQIPEINEKDWDTLNRKLYAGEPRVQEMTPSPISFQVFAAQSDLAGFKFFSALALLIPVSGIVLAFVYSWWFLVLVLAFPVFTRIAKGFYRTVIFQAVTASEAAFCFLFSRNTICLVQNGQLVFRHNE